MNYLIILKRFRLISEWKEFAIGDLGLVVTGKIPLKNNPEDWSNMMPFVTLSNYKNYGTQMN